MNENCNKMLKIFFSSKYEQGIESKVLDGTFSEIKDEVVNYINQLNSIEIIDFIEYIKTFHTRQPVLAADVFQFSDFDNATTNLCKKMAQTPNSGLKCKEIGMLLRNDNKSLSNSALTKYGENHIKMAESLGLAFKDKAGFYYLSGVGYILADLPYGQQEKILTRLLVRNKLLSQLFVVALQGEVDLEAFLYDLSESTYKRRRTNINCVIEILNTCKEYDFKYLTENIKY